MVEKKQKVKVGKPKNKPGGYPLRRRYTFSSIIEDHLTYTDAPCERICFEIIKRRDKDDRIGYGVDICRFCPVSSFLLDEILDFGATCQWAANAAGSVARKEELGELENDEAVANALAEIALCLKAQGD